MAEIPLHTVVVGLLDPSDKLSGRIGVLITNVEGGSGIVATQGDTSNQVGEVLCLYDIASGGETSLNDTLEFIDYLKNY